MSVIPLLKQLGPIPGSLVHLDFETFYSADYSLSKLTNEAYVRDERFEVIGVGVKVGKAPAVWLEEWDFARWVKRVDWSAVSLNCHHAQFDGFILSEHYGVRPGFWFDTMYLGRRAVGEGSLERLAQKLGLGEKGDDIKSGWTKGKRRRDFTQREWERFGRYCCQDVELSAAALRHLAPKLPRLEWWLLDTTIRMFTEPSFCADLDLLRKALDDERGRKAVFLDALMERHDAKDPEAARKLLASADKFADLLRSIGIDPPMKLNAKGQPIYAFAKTDPGMAEFLEGQREDARFLAEARLAVKSTIVETRTERLIGIGQRGRVPIYLKYCGAHTDRWSGGDKMNPQNFSRAREATKTKAAVPSPLRDAMMAPDGHVVVVVDSGQIEARVLPWLAGETSLLDTFRANDAKTRRYQAAFAERVAAMGDVVTEEQAKAIDRELAALGIFEGDFYSDEGTRYFLKPISKKTTPLERQISKAMVLGLGFNMGWLKFGLELLKGLLGADPVQFGAREVAAFGVDVAAFANRPSGLGGPTCGERVRGATSRIGYEALLTHCAVADHFVRLYRAKNPAIAKLWKTCESMLAIMEEPDGDPEAVRFTYRGLQVKRHAILKPNGMTLRYPGLHKRADGFAYIGGKSGRERVKIYGGLLTENLVQSLARDIVAEQVLRIRADGYRIATTTHDEGVAIVPDHQAEDALEASLRHFRTAPEWCADLPLNADGGMGKRYGDAK